MKEETIQPAPAKVRITKCSFPAGWYKSLIGEVFEVDNASPPKDYVLWEDYINRNHIWRHIAQEDCERIETTVPPPPQSEGELWKAGLKDIPEPIGNFILEQKDIRHMEFPDGHYYHYSDVCVMLQRILSSRFASLRSDKPEPVKFAEWVATNGYAYDAEDNTWNKKGCEFWKTTMELFKLFKEDTNKPQPELFTKEQVLDLIAKYGDYYVTGMAQDKWTDPDFKGNIIIATDFLEEQLKTK